MKTKIGCLAVLASVMGMAAEASAMRDSYEGAGNRGLSLIIQEDQPPIMLAATRSPTATDAASAPAAATTRNVKYDAVYSMCGYKHSADQVPVLIERDNLVSPLGALGTYFFKLNGKLPNFLSAQGVPEPLQVKILKAPEHGVLVPGNKEQAYFIYHATPDYLGSDQMIFEVETMGKKFKVIQTVIVDNSGDLDYPTPKAVETGDKVCPSEKGSSLDIIELPTDGFASDEELAKLHSLLSFAL